MHPLCALRNSCTACRGQSSFRRAQGLPEVCPFGISFQPILRDMGEREAICRACYHFEAGGCRVCSCKEASRRPWYELNACPRNRWTVPPPPPQPPVS